MSESENKSDQENCPQLLKSLWDLALKGWKNREVRLSPDSPYIYNPRFLGEDMRRIKAIVRLPDGRIVEMEGDREDQSSRFINEVFVQYSMEEIITHTARENKITEHMQHLRKRLEEDRKIEAEREATVQAKMRALEIPEVKDCPDVMISRNIRRAKSSVEVMAWTAIALLKSTSTSQDINL